LPAAGGAGVCPAASPAPRGEARECASLALAGMQNMTNEFYPKIRDDFEVKLSRNFDNRKAQAFETPPSNKVSIREASSILHSRAEFLWTYFLQNEKQALFRSRLRRC
jgi:hypothetical protein